MPMKKKSPLRRRRVAKRKVGKRRSGVPEWASLSCTRTMSLAGGAQFNTNTLYSKMNTQLIDFERASLVSQGYQMYRIKNITMSFKPSYDTFTASGGPSKTFLYYQIDRSGTVPTDINLEGLKQMGCKPRALDEKPVKISWRPSVLEGVMYAPGVVGALSASKYKLSPWLSCNASAVEPSPVVPSGVDHLGIYWYVDQLANPVGVQYSIDIEVQFEFKKPSDDQNTSTGITAIPAIMAPRNQSADGVEGGGDGV